MGWPLPLAEIGRDAAGVSELLREVGRVVAIMHDGGLVHGDLTTSNLLVRDSDHAVVSCPREGHSRHHIHRYLNRLPVFSLDLSQAIIDFGLSSNSTLNEDKAVDLYVLERAVTSTLVSDADVVSKEAADCFSVLPHALLTKLMYNCSSARLSRHIGSIAETGVLSSINLQKVWAPNHKSACKIYLDCFASQEFIQWSAALSP